MEETAAARGGALTVEIIIGDCMQVMTGISDESFDLLLVDPPYGETSLEWDRWPHGWPAAVRRLLKRTGSMWVFGSMRMFWDHRDEFDGWNLAQDVIWEKHNGSGFHADRFKRVHENAVHLYRDDAPWEGVYKLPQFTNDATARTVRRKRRPAHMGHIEASAYASEDGGPRLVRSVIYCRSEHGRAVHPTQKPMELFTRPLEYHTLRGDVCLEPFLGSGTQLIAAERTGRRCFAVERDPRYVDIALMRWEAFSGMRAVLEPSAPDAR